MIGRIEAGVDARLQKKIKLRPELRVEEEAEPTVKERVVFRENKARGRLLKK